MWLRARDRRSCLSQLQQTRLARGVPGLGLASIDEAVIDRRGAWLLVGRGKINATKTKSLTHAWQPRAPCMLLDICRTPMGQVRLRMLDRTRGIRLACQSQSAEACGRWSRPAQASLNVPLTLDRNGPGVTTPQAL